MSDFLWSLKNGDLEQVKEYVENKVSSRYHRMPNDVEMRWVSFKLLSRKSVHNSIAGYVIVYVVFCRRRRVLRKFETPLKYCRFMGDCCGRGRPVTPTASRYGKVHMRLEFVEY